ASGLSVDAVSPATGSAAAVPGVLDVASADLSAGLHADFDVLDLDLARLGAVARAVVALAAGLEARAAATRLPTEPSTTTVTPASASARSTFLAWAGVTFASSTVRATWADVICPPAASA